MLARIGPAAEAAISALAALPAWMANPFHALAAIGHAAVPTLIQLLDDPEKCTAAADALGRIGPAAAAAVPALLDYHGDGSRDWDPRWAIFLIGKSQVPFLIRVLQQDADSDRRVRAANALGLLKVDCPNAIPALIDSLADPDERVFVAVSEILNWDVGNQESEAKYASFRDCIPLLKTAIQSENPRIRVGAAAALTVGMRDSIAGDEVVVPLDQGLNDPAACVRRLAAKAIQIRAIPVPSLESALHDDDPVVRANVAVALCKLDRTHISGLIQVLVETLFERDAEREFWHDYGMEDTDLENSLRAVGTDSIPLLVDVIWLRADEVQFYAKASEHIIRDVLISFGSEALPHLRQAAISAPSLLTSTEFLRILHDIEPEEVFQALHNPLPEVRRAAASVIAYRTQSWRVDRTSYRSMLRRAIEAETDAATLQWMESCLDSCI
ncbi:MAG: HEAT repeat domain-containing protein [Planctomycetaceae bacterium]|nr:HEAT repeat domain-containing protein [Planctomycetaceae bacterium]